MNIDYFSGLDSDGVSLEHDAAFTSRLVTRTLIGAWIMPPSSPDDDKVPGLDALIGRRHIPFDEFVAVLLAASNQPHLQ